MVLAGRERGARVCVLACMCAYTRNCVHGRTKPQPLYLVEPFSFFTVCAFSLLCSQCGGCGTFRAKISNIEATEDAKQKLLWERMHKKEEVSEFVPTNMAVNYMQHNRCEWPGVV